MSVDFTYCLSEWEKYFTEKPLSFNEFVETYEGKETIFPHILKKIDEISRQPSKLEYFIQGFIGSGKSTLVGLLTVYKVYLFLILKSPHEFYEMADTTLYHMVIYSPSKKHAELSVRSLIEIMGRIPFFHKVRSIRDCFNYDANTAIFTTDCNNCLLLFRKGNATLRVVPAKDPVDIIGLNIVIGLMVELQPYDDDEGENVFTFYQKLHWRIDSRCKGKLSALIVDKYPNNYYYDMLDRYIYDVAVKNQNAMCIFFQNRWKFFNPECKADKTFNISTCEVVDEDSTDSLLPGDSFVDFPSEVNGFNLLALATKNPQEFLRDWIGMPVFLKKSDSKAYEAMKEIANLIHEHNIQICYKNGKMYLEKPSEKLCLALEDF